MDKLLKQIEVDFKNKILATAKNGNIVKPTETIFESVRKELKKKYKHDSSKESIYKEIVEEFLKQHPEFILKEEK